MWKIIYNEMTKQNATTATFTPSERTLAAEERLFKEEHSYFALRMPCPTL